MSIGGNFFTALRGKPGVTFFFPSVDHFAISRLSYSFLVKKGYPKFLFDSVLFFRYFQFILPHR